MSTIDIRFLQKVSNILEEARKSVKTAVNLSMVYSYYEVGRIIVEEEQNGQEKAGYGKYILKELSQYLTANLGKGFSVTNLKQMRQFYLSWSHYLQLMRIDNIDERHFYEIEAVQNDWSLAELKRQFNSALFERLALSKNKVEMLKMAQKG